MEWANDRDSANERGSADERDSAHERGLAGGNDSAGEIGSTDGRREAGGTRRVPATENDPVLAKGVVYVATEANCLTV